MNNSTVEDVLVFKTSIRSENEVAKIRAFLNGDDKIRRWNIDCQDIDHVLRIESEDHDPEYFIQIITEAGFLCEELPD